MTSAAAASGPHRARLEPVPAAATPADRVARGKAARAAVPRLGHGPFRPAAGRPDPVSLLERQAAARVPELLPIRYGRMLASPFAFFRGAALPMASDLAQTPATGLTVQACGDAHLSNFGIFASPERRLVFDINDFDETLPGPWEWDVKRLAASLEVAARDNGFPRRQRRAIVLAAVARYRGAMRGLGGPGRRGGVVRPRTWISSGALPGHPRPAGAPAGGRGPGQGPGPDSLQALDKLTVTVEGQPRIRRAPAAARAGGGLARRAGLEAVEADLNGIVADYRRTLESDRQFLIARYRVVDMAQQGGRRRQRGHALLGRPAARPRRLRPAVPPGQGGGAVGTGGVRRRHAVSEPGAARGRRASGSCRRPATSSSAGTGPGSRPGHDYYVRQLRDWKFSLAVEEMDPDTMRTYAQLCGQTLARAHARSGDRIAIGGLPRQVATPSTGPWPSSPPPTPTRTSATTPAWPPRPRPAGWRPSAASSPVADAPGPQRGPGRYFRAAAQRTQVAAVGRTASRSAPIGSPHRSQVP